MTKQTFFHQDYSFYKKLPYKGFSLLIAQQTNGDLKVTHTYCGRGDTFSKKKARETLRDYQQQGKHTVDVYLADLPRYMAQIDSGCFKKKHAYVSSDYRDYCWRFVPKSDAGD